MGQGTVSTITTDYKVWAVGATVRTSSLSSDYCKIGHITGNGTGATPTIFTDDRTSFAHSPALNHLNLEQLAKDIYTTWSLDDDGNANLATPLETQISNLIANLAKQTASSAGSRSR